MQRLDLKNDGFIRFESYINDLFDTTNFYADFEKNEGTTDIHRMHSIEKAKWHFVSNDPNMEKDVGQLHLSNEEFYKIFFSEEFDALREFESKFTFEIYDADKNNYISVREFIEIVKCKIFYFTIQIILLRTS